MRSLFNLAVLLLLPLSACSLFEPEPATATFKTMGTRAAVTLAGLENEKLAKAAVDAERLMAALEAELSIYRADSVVSRLNSLAGVRPMEVPEHTRRLLEISIKYGDLTSGAFDVTLGPVVGLWRPKPGQTPSLPTEDALQEKLALVNFRNIKVQGSEAFLPTPGMRVDLGGIAKGYAVDLAWQALRRRGAVNFMFDLGGNIRVSGKAGSGLPWSIAVRSPFDTSRNLANVAMPDGWAVATSGQYERFVEIEGRRYGHIIDPRTGYPAAGLAGVTVFAREATMTDGLSTALFVLGPQKSVPVLRKTGAEAIFIPDKEPPELWVTPGIQSRLSLLEEAKVTLLPGW